MPEDEEDPSIEEYLRGLTDRARLFSLKREQMVLEALRNFRRAIENGEDLDGF